jgi:hypothetical protein
MPEATDREITDRIVVALEMVLNRETDAAASLAVTKLRLGLADMDVYEQDARSEMDRDSSLAGIVILCFYMPRHSRHWVRVKIVASPEPWGIIEPRSVPGWFCDAEPDYINMNVRDMILDTRPLDAAQCLKILDILASKSLSQKVDVRRGRIMSGGCPCELLAICRDPRQTVHMRFNLQQSEYANHPAWELARQIISLYWIVLRSPWRREDR